MNQFLLIFLAALQSATPFQANDQNNKVKIIGDAISAIADLSKYSILLFYQTI